MGPLEKHTRRHLVLMRFEPSRCAKAPAVTGLQTWEPELGSWRGEIIASESRKLEELPGQPYAHGVRSEILVAGVATAIPVLVAGVATAIPV